MEHGRRIIEALESAGFSPVLKAVNPIQYRDEVWRDKDYQLSIGELQPASTTNSFLFAILHSEGSWNVLAHSDSRLGPVHANVPHYVVNIPNVQR